MKNKYALIILTSLYFIILMMNSFVIIMENRIAPMGHLSLIDAPGRFSFIIIFFASILLLLSIINNKWPYQFEIMLVIVYLSFFTMFLEMGDISTYLVRQNGSGYRVTFGYGFYASSLILYAIAIKLKQNTNQFFFSTISFVFILSLLSIFTLGWMNDTSIMIEFFTRKDKFIQTLNEHIIISLKVILLSIFIGLPLGYFCERNKHINTLIIGFLNVTRSIPSIALIMLMVPIISKIKDISIFSNLGISSFGETPLFLALFFYSLFQIVVNFISGLRTVPDDMIKVALGLGMTRSTVFRKIEIPIVLPVVFSGIKLAAVSTFTGVSLGTMVGYGGLGTFITMGSGSAIALDLILLGSIPIMIMIFVFNWLSDQGLKFIYKLMRIDTELAFGL